MNEPTNDGGPAFPVTLTYRPTDGMPMSAGEYFNGGNGMTLRDYFAAMALAHVPLIMDRNDDNLSYENMADHSYQMADAMLKERRKS